METADRFHEHLTTESTSLNVTIDSFLMGTLSGEASWQIRNNSGSPQELYFNLNSGYRVRSITANGEPLPFEDLKNDYIASRELRCTPVSYTHLFKRYQSPPPSAKIGSPAKPKII